MWNALPPSMRPTGRGVTENIIANIVVGAVGTALSVTGAAVLTWFAEPRTNLGLVIVFLGAMTVFSAAWLAFAFGWRRMFPIEAQQAAVFSEASIMPPPTLPANVQEAQTRHLTTYEIEQKLRLIDEALANLRGPMLTGLVKAHELIESCITSYKRNDSTYSQRLEDCRAGVASAVANLESLKERHPQHKDILLVLEQPTGANLAGLMGNLRGGYNDMALYLDKSAPDGVFARAIGPRVSEASHAHEKLVRWKNDTEKKLLNLRQNVSG